MIPNIVKGSGITGAIRYNLGEGNDKTTNTRKAPKLDGFSRTEILGGQGFGFAVDSVERVELARRIMEFNGLPENQTGRTKKCRLDCLHMSLSWEPGQKPSNEEMFAAAQSALKALGMETAQAVFFRHNDVKAPHLHIVASRISPLTGMTFSDTRDNTKAHAWALQWERENGQIPEARRALHRLVAAVIARDSESIAEALTERNPTFTRRDLDKALSYGQMDPAEAKSFRATMLSHPAIVGLRETKDGSITRYTTQAVLAAEAGILADAEALAAMQVHGTGYAAQRNAAAFHTLTAEQERALKHGTEANGFAMVAGQAGTGKSRVIGAIRDTYEAEGFRVVGLAWTNSVVEDLRAKGFAYAATLSAELGLRSGKLSAPAARWDDRTVAIVDEAAMLATKDLAALTSRAREAGAKLILVGDDKQLSSIERGGMFAPLRQAHGAAEIAEVQRVSKQSQKDAFTLMHKGEFRPAMALFEQEGALRFAPNAAKAEAELIKQFTADVQTAPDKSRFIFAHTNAQVERLNAMARDAARNAGKLGVDHRLVTANGPQDFAIGDRIQFTGNGKSRQGKEAGFVNGATGIIKMIEVEAGKARLSVALDAGKVVSFAVGDGKGEFNQFRPGYAGTIYKGQGKSIDQTYVLVSQGWRAESSYVAMTRHKESVSVFVPKDVAADHGALAGLMGRDEQKRAASGYIADAESLARARLPALDPISRTPRPVPGKEPPVKTRPAPIRGKSAQTRETPQEARKTPEGRAGASPRQAKPSGRAKAAGKGRGAVAGSFMRGAIKALQAGLDGLAALFEGGSENLTPEQRIERAKEDHETAKDHAASDKVAAEDDRLALERQAYQRIGDLMGTMFPAETRDDRLRREEEDHQHKGGRRRGR